jgi:hypothetical protein
MTGITAEPPTQDGPDGAHRRPPGVSDETVAALGKLGEALECTERARGHLYALHQLTGHADLMLDEAADLLRRAGHEEHARRLERELIGRNVVAGRWTFQLVEDYDDNYYAVFRALEKQARDALAGGRRHLHEAEMKERRRSRGEPGHEARPAG